MACEKEIWQKIGEGFVQEYYNQFDNTNRVGLGNLYVSLFFPLLYSHINDLYWVAVAQEVASCWIGSLTRCSSCHISILFVIKNLYVHYVI